MVLLSVRLSQQTPADSYAAKASALGAAHRGSCSHLRPCTSPQGNQAQQLGGGLAIAESPGARVVLRSGTFTENAAGLGGGLHADNETEACCITNAMSRSNTTWCWQHCWPSVYAGVCEDRRPAADSSCASTVYWVRHILTAL